VETVETVATMPNNIAKRANPSASATAKRALILKLITSIKSIKLITTNSLTLNAPNLKAAELNAKMNAAELKVSQGATDTDHNLHNTNVDNRRNKH